MFSDRARLAPALATLALASAFATAQEPGFKWEADLKVLTETLAQKHPDLHRRLSKKDFEKAVADCRENLADGDDLTRVVALRRLVAAFGDSHTYVYADRETKTPPISRLPAAFHVVTEGPIVFALPEDLGAHVGSVVSRFGGVPFEEARARLLSLVAAENDSQRALRLPDLMTEVPVLRALKLCGDDGATTIETRDAAGVASTFVLKPPADAAEARAIRFKRAPDFDAWPRTSPARRALFGAETFDDVRTLYVWYDACRDDGDATVAAFADEVLKKIDAGFGAQKPTIDRVVVDLRRNGGGDSRLLEPLIDGLSKRKALEEKGRLSVLVGRRTFSSAVLNAFALRKRTRAVFYGEPTGGALNHFGEVKTFRLPSTGLVVQHSTKEFRLVEGDGAAFEPDVVVPATAADFRAAKDVVFEAALR